MKLYLASGLSNRATVSQIAQDLRELGHVITYDWTTHGSVQDASDEEKAAVAMAELAGVLAADLVVAILPGGRGTHVEIGAALGAGIPVVVIYLRARDLLVDGVECVFYRHRGVWLTGFKCSDDGREWLADWIASVAEVYEEDRAGQIAEAAEARNARHLGQRTDSRCDFTNKRRH